MKSHVWIIEKRWPNGWLPFAHRDTRSGARDGLRIWRASYPMSQFRVAKYVREEPK